MASAGSGTIEEEPLQLHCAVLGSIAMPMSDSLCCYAPQSMPRAAPESSTLLNLLLLLWRIKWPKRVESSRVESVGECG